MGSQLTQVLGTGQLRCRIFIGRLPALLKYTKIAHTLSCYHFEPCKLPLPADDNTIIVISVHVDYKTMVTDDKTIKST